MIYCGYGSLALSMMVQYLILYLVSMYYREVSKSLYHYMLVFLEFFHESSPFIGWALDRWVGQSVGQLVAWSIGRSVARSVGRSVNRSLGRSIARSLGRSIGRSVGRSAGRPVGRSAGRSVGRSVGRSFGQKLDTKHSWFRSNIFSGEVINIGNIR